MKNSELIMLIVKIRDSQLREKFSSLQHRLRDLIDDSKQTHFLTLFRMGLFGTANRWLEAKRALLSKIYHTYPTLTKLAQLYLT